jgi:hypothetical protein
MCKNRLLVLSVLAWPLLAGSDPDATAQVTTGKDACYEIRLPKCWHYADGRYCLGDQAMNLQPAYLYEFRRVAIQPDAIFVGSRHKEAFRSSPHGDQDKFATRPQPGDPSSVIRESPERYAITLGKPVRIRHATAAEWNNADPLLAFASPAAPDHNHFDRSDESNRRAYIYVGRSFAKSGPLWALGNENLLSGDGRYLTVHSWDGNGGGCGDWVCLPIPSNNTGRYWIDLYEVATGRRLLAVTGKTHYAGGDNFVAGAQWSGNYFVLPLTATLDRFLLCDADAAVKRGQK